MVGHVFQSELADSDFSDNVEHVSAVVVSCTSATMLLAFQWDDKRNGTTSKLPV